MFEISGRMIEIVVFILGVVTIAVTLASAIRTFVLPRSERVLITRIAFRAVRCFFDLRLYWAQSYFVRDRTMALFAPVALLTLPIVWLLLIFAGYVAIYWAVGVGPVKDAIRLSGSSLLTLGYDHPQHGLAVMLSFSEAAIGLLLIALLIAYLPTMYAAFSRREVTVSMLQIRAGSPPSAIEMIERLHLLGGLSHLGDLWSTWESWFVELEETHTSLGALVFFRSPHPERSWVTASATILDAAAFSASALDLPPDPRRELCLRSGYVSLHRIAGYLGLRYDHDPDPDTPLLVPREAFDQACERLREAGVPLKADLEEAWNDFTDWRTNYEEVVVALAELTMAPDSFWDTGEGSGHRSLWPRRIREKRRAWNGRSRTPDAGTRAAS